MIKAENKNPIEAKKFEFDPSVKPVGFKNTVKHYFFKTVFSLKKSIMTYPCHYLAFILPMAILVAVFACIGMFPLGAKTILTLDMDGQYVYFFEQLRDVFSGDASLLYTFERSLGGEFLGYFTYYLASPLSLVVVIFPKKMITEAIMTMMILKSGFCGLSFSFYLSRTRKRNAVGFTMFSVMYALCAYGTMYQFNTMWMDALIWLPLIALGIEKLISEGKFKLFTISLAIGIWSNYYIGYMLCIFVAVYFFFALFSKPQKENNLLLENRHILKSFIRIAIFSAVALMLAATMITSAYYSLSFGKSTFQDSDFAPELRFDVLHLISKMFIGSFDTVRDVGTPNIYAGTLIVLLLPVFFMSKKITPREKIAYSVLSFVFILSFSVNTIDLVWHGFQEPIWFNYRYSFMFTFVLLVMAYKAYECIDEVNATFLGKTSVFLIFLLAIIQKTITYVRYEWTGSSRVQVTDKPGFAMLWLSFLFILAYFLLFYVNKKTFLKRTATMLIAVVVCIEAFASTTINWVGEINDGGWASRTNYRQYVDKLESAADSIYAKDKGFYRVEHTIFRKSNDNLVANIKGISEFTSTFNQSTINFLQKIGIYTDGQTTKYLGSSVLVDSLLGVKYIIGSGTDDTNGNFPNKNSVSSLYNSYSAENGLVIYENPYALPIAYCADINFKGFEFTSSELSFVNNSNNLLNSVLGYELNAFEPCKYQELTQNRVNISIPLTNKYSSDEWYDIRRNEGSSSPAKIYYSVTATRDGNIYMNFPTPWTTAVTLTVNNVEFTKSLFQGDNKGVINLGNYKKGDNITVGLEFNNYRLNFQNSGSFFVQINEEKLNEASALLKANGLKLEKYSDTNLKGTIHADKNGCVFTTIPYDTNWKVYVDGERVDTYKLVDSMVGFDISVGDHTVEFKYVHSAFNMGLAVSVAGLLIFIALCILDKKFGAKPVLITDAEQPKEDNTENNDSSEENNDIPS